MPRAQAEGRQAALDEVDQMIQKQLATVIPALRQAILDIHQAKQAWLAQWEASAVHLAAEIAKRLIRGELTRQPQIPQTLVREALQLAAGQGEVRLLLNPADHRALAGQVKLLVDEMTGLGETQIVADAAISPGGCRVETRFGAIDQTLKRNLPEWKRSLVHDAMKSMIEQLDRVMTTAVTGSVAQTVGMTVSAAGFPAPVGAIAEIQRRLRISALGRSDRLPQRNDPALSAWRSGRHPPRQPRAAEANCPLAPRGRRTFGPRGRRRAAAPSTASRSRPSPSGIAPIASRRMPAPARASTGRCAPASAPSMAC